MLPVHFVWGCKKKAEITYCGSKLHSCPNDCKMISMRLLWKVHLSRAKFAPQQKELSSPGWNVTEVVPGILCSPQVETAWMVILVLQTLQAHSTLPSHTLLARSF